MKKNILIVDDKAAIAKVVAMYLSADYNFIYYDSALKAINWLSSGNKPDLIISDIRMPDMAGDEFLVFLKNNEMYKRIPVIMLSAEDNSNARIKLLEQGAEDYIVKPFNPQELKVRINKILR